MTSPEPDRAPEDPRNRAFRPASLFNWLVPKSLKARTNLLLLFGIACVQCLSFGIYALDRFWLTDRAVMQESKHRALSIYQVITSLPIRERTQAVANLRLPPSFSVKLSDRPDEKFSGPLPPQYLSMLPSTPRSGSLQLVPEVTKGDRNPTYAGQDHPSAPRVFLIYDRDGERVDSVAEAHDLVGLMMLAGDKRPRAIVFERRTRSHLFSMSMRCSDEDRWLVVRFHVPPPNPFGSWTFFAALLTMAVGGGVVIALGTQRLITPIGTLSSAAEKLGTDVFTPPLPEKGATEIRRAAHIFNLMAERIRRFLRDRTLILTALSHDLRTPLTRMKLRTEFIEDPELRERFTADLAEMEKMVATTLALGRDPTHHDPLIPIDLTRLIQDVVADIKASRPEDVEKIDFSSQEVAVTIRAQTLLLKRALSNIILNALIYGDRAQIALRLEATRKGGRQAVITIEDNGPGVPEDQRDHMFEPFTRGEKSRNRETGGHGLGLAIARSAMQTHRGTITLANRAEGGLRATLILPCDADDHPVQPASLFSQRP
ncbi:ATP-binding protein [Sorlinia euscelidii]|uniref:histidine kinase n=1 Tax=Sorlinia euscelidii TaxID=3081148 RepID=A0ABU7U447_9PROT